MNTTKRIVVIGPESTGKSTLAQMLTSHYKAAFVPEFARRYIEELGGDYEETDLLKIAEGQIKTEDKMAKTNPNFLFCDTDLYVIKVWSEHKYGHCSNSILQEIAHRKYDLYLLTDIDMPWEEDPQREYPSPMMRSYFFHIYQDIVIHSGCPWSVVSGNPRQRLRSAIQSIEKHFN